MSLFPGPTTALPPGPHVLAKKGREVAGHFRLVLRVLTEIAEAKRQLRY